MGGTLNWYDKLTTQLDERQTAERKLLGHLEHDTAAGEREEGCIVGARLVSYAKLCRSYVCDKCGGRIVQHIRWDEVTQTTNRWAECGTCGGQDFISARRFEKQVGEFPIIVHSLPDHLRELISPRPDITGPQAIAELFDL